MDDKKPVVKEMDVNENRERFEFDVRNFVIGQTIQGLISRSDRICIDLSNGRRIEFAVKGPDIEMTIPVPDDPDPVPLSGKVM